VIKIIKKRNIQQGKLRRTKETVPFFGPPGN